MSSRLLSRGLGRFAASKAPSTLLDRSPAVSGKNPLSVLAPIGSGNHRNDGKTAGKEMEKKDRKSRKTDKKNDGKKGEVTESSMTGSKTGASLPSTTMHVPDRKFSPYKALGDIKDTSEPATRTIPPVFQSMKCNATSIPGGLWRSRDGWTDPAGRKEERSVSFSTLSSPRSQNQRSSSRAMTKRPSQAVEMDDGVRDSLVDNQRRHESLAERVKSLLTSRSQDNTTRRTDATETYASYRHRSSELANREAEVCLPRHVNTAANPSTESSTDRGRGLAEEYCPISDENDKLIPHPPASRHVIRSRLVYEFRKRRFKFASLRLM